MYIYKLYKLEIEITILVQNKIFLQQSLITDFPLFSENKDIQFDFPHGKYWYIIFGWIVVILGEFSNSRIFWKHF